MTDKIDNEFQGMLERYNKMKASRSRDSSLHKSRSMGVIPLDRELPAVTDRLQELGDRLKELEVGRAEVIYRSVPELEDLRGRLRGREGKVNRGLADGLLEKYTVQLVSFLEVRDRATGQMRSRQHILTKRIEEIDQFRYIYDLQNPQPINPPSTPSKPTAEQLRLISLQAQLKKYKQMCKMYQQRLKPHGKLCLLKQPEVEDIMQRSRIISSHKSHREDSRYTGRTSEEEGEREVGNKKGAEGLFDYMKELEEEVSCYKEALLKQQIETYGRILIS